MQLRFLKKKQIWVKLWRSGGYVDKVRVACGRLITWPALTVVFQVADCHNWHQRQCYCYGN